jgi:hypothetical protein
MSDEQRAERLRALWKSGRDKYVSFFAVLDEVRREVGDEALPNWCIDNLRIGLAVIASTKKILIKADADIVKRNFAAAAVAEKAQAYAVREEARLARELDKTERAKRIAEARTEAEHARLEAERAKAETTRTKAKAKAKANKASDNGQRAERKRRAFISSISDAELAELVSKFKKAEALCQEGERQWIEGSVAKALILHAARIKHRSDPEFGAWLEANAIYAGNENRHTRAALIGLASHGESRLREILSTTDSRSYEIIWNNNRIIQNSVSERSESREG